jgi:predicted lipid-binding transport protein (Tim44 family)
LEIVLKALLLALSVAVAGVSLAVAPFDADARRLGGGRAAGMQRQVPPKPVQPPPANPAQASPQGTAAAPANAAAAAPAARSRWLAPVAGLAAGLGLAALAAHLGLSEAFATVVTVLLLAVVGLLVVRWLMRRMAGGVEPVPNRGVMRYAAAGAARPEAPMVAGSPMTARRAANEFLTTDAAVDPARLPAGFDVQEFERIAKMIFIRLQAANDAGHVEDLRKFTTPELFASLRVDLQEREGVSQQTDVLKLEAQVVETAQENDQWIVSVRFSGLIRENAEAPAEPFDEVWHLVKPVDNSREWAIAGIAPQQ